MDRFFEKLVATTLDRSLSGPGTIPRLPKAVQSGFLPKKAKKTGLDRTFKLYIFMGRQLVEVYPVFLNSIRENDRILVEKYGQESMLECMGLFIPGAECELAVNGVWPVQEVMLSFVFV